MHLCGQGRRYVTLDDMALRELARNDPELLIQRFPPPALIDEIQYAPQLLPQIKLAIDRGARKGDYWLTGSQQFHMMSGVTESLAGRVAVISILGFSAREHERRPSETAPFMPDRDGALFPVEVKLGATPKPRWVQSFKALHRLGKPVGPGVVICMRAHPCPIDRENNAVPISMI